MILAAASAVLLSASPALAQQKGAANTITRTSIASQLDANFAATDTNHDGSLSLSEIQALQAKELKAIEAQVQAKLQATFKQLDTNKDGQLSFAEFAATAGGIKANETPQQVLQKIDTNHDGKLSAAEFKAPRLAAFDRIDANHDGVITADEARRASQK
jgi:Ca2+-binding EF-hand superfamily protein